MFDIQCLRKKTNQIGGYCVIKDKTTCHDRNNFWPLSLINSKTTKETFGVRCQHKAIEKTPKCNVQQSKRDNCFLGWVPTSKQDKEARNNLWMTSMEKTRLACYIQLSCFCLARLLGQHSWWTQTVMVTWHMYTRYYSSLSSCGT